MHRRLYTFLLITCFTLSIFAQMDSIIIPHEPPDPGQKGGITFIRTAMLTTRKGDALSSRFSFTICHLLSDLSRSLSGTVDSIPGQDERTSGCRRRTGLCTSGGLTGQDSKFILDKGMMPAFVIFYYLLLSSLS